MGGPVASGRAIDIYIGMATNGGHSSGVAENGRLVRRMSHRVDPAAIAEPQYGPPVLSWFNSGLNGQGRPLAGLGRSPAWRF